MHGGGLEVPGPGSARMSRPWRSPPGSLTAAGRPRSSRPRWPTLMTLAESPQSCSAEFPTLLGVRLRDLRLVVLSSSDQFSVCATPR